MKPIFKTLSPSPRRAGCSERLRRGRPLENVLGWPATSVCLGVICALANEVGCGAGGGAPATSSDVDGGISSSSPIAADAGDPIDAASAGDSAAAAADSPASDAEGGTGPIPLPDGVYVAPTGADMAPGTPGSPVKTIAAGLKLAMAAGKPVFLCANTTYAEAANITSAIAIDGSRDCTNGWASTTSYATVAPATGVPFTINAGKASVALSYLHMVAADNYDLGMSVIGLFAIASTNVALNNCEISAGNAGDGLTPKPPVAQTEPAPGGANATPTAPTECVNGNNTGFCAVVYPGASSSYGSCYGQGGAGGNGGNAEVGSPAQSGQSGLPSGVGGQGGAAAWNQPGKGAGLPGSAGTTGAAGSPATSGFGDVSSLAYKPTNSGTAGGIGGPGGGGGGGAGGYSGTWGDPSLCGIDFLGAGGGEGGYGGCGGQGAPGGGGGGASIALLSIASPLSLTDVILDTAAGGRGGNSAPGATGEPGGQGGAGALGSHPSFTNDCLAGNQGGNSDSGGPGGVGGKGGPGGPGGGGPSVGLVATGVAPALKNVSYNLGTGGAGGKALVGKDGAPGVTSDTWFVGIPDAGTP